MQSAAPKPYETTCLKINHEKKKTLNWEFKQLYQIPFLLILNMTRHPAFFFFFLWWLLFETRDRESSFPNWKLETRNQIAHTLKWKLLHFLHATNQSANFDILTRTVMSRLLYACLCWQMLSLLSQFSWVISKSYQIFIVMLLFVTQFFYFFPTNLTRLCFSFSFLFVGLHECLNLRI